jgi:hypothetical protein
VLRRPIETTRLTRHLGVHFRKNVRIVLLQRLGTTGHSFAMALLLRCSTFGFLLTLLLSTLVLCTTGEASSLAFWLILPGVWLIGVVVAPFVGQSDSGGVNLIVGIVAGSVLNTGIYALLFFLVNKIIHHVRRPNADSAPLESNVGNATGVDRGATES